MVTFEKKWQKINGKRIFYVHPTSAVFDDDWVAFFENELKNYLDDNFFLILDIRGIEENIGYDGFTRIADLLKKKNIKLIRIGVLATDPGFFEMLAKLFGTIAEAKGINLQVEVFEEMELACAWYDRSQD